MPGPADPSEAKLAVVIPAYQAAPTVHAVVVRVRRAAPGAAVIVVDDGSTDGTGDQGRAAGATVLDHARNLGKGAALATGVAAALEAGVRAIVTLDADGQHPPEDVARLAGPVLAGEADLVLGARRRTAAMPLTRRCTNWLSATLAGRVAGQPVADAQTGFRAFTRAVAERVRPAERRYDYEAAFLLGALVAGFRVRSIPIDTIYDGAGSHFRHWTDTWRVARVFARFGSRILTGAR